jgi:ABC-type microcin C transport system permease subunit YejE
MMSFKDRLTGKGPVVDSGIYIFAGIFIIAILFLSIYPAVAFADGHEDASELEHKVDTENQSGINLLIATIYNENRLLFALVVTATMAVVGVIIGQIAGVFLRLVGLK